MNKFKRLQGTIFYAVILISLPASTQAEEWYEGGTLHRSTLSEWSKATSHNRLATAGDYAAHLKLSADIDELHDWAIEITSCLDEIAADPSLHNQSTASMAAMCVTLIQAQ